jgi:hypothetical protein
MMVFEHSNAHLERVVGKPGRQCGLYAGIGKYDGICAERREHVDHEI